MIPVCPFRQRGWGRCDLASSLLDVLAAVSAEAVLVTFARRIGYAAGVAIALPIIFALLSESSYRSTLARNRQTDRDHEAFDRTNVLERLVIDMETANRGFRNSGDERFLEPDAIAARQYGPMLGELKALIGWPEERVLVDDLRARIDRYRSTFAEPLVQFVRTHPLAREDGRIVVAQAPPALSSAEGKRQMDDMRTRFQTLQALESRRIDEDLTSTSKAVAQLTTVLWTAAAGFSILLLLGALALFRAYQRRSAVLFAGIDAAERGTYRAIPLGGEDELARIAAAFNRMQEEVERRDEELRSSLSELEGMTTELTTQQKTLISTQAQLLAGGLQARSDAREAERARASLDVVLASVGEGIYQFDVEGRVIYLNPAAERLLGYSIREIRGRNMHDLIHAHSPDGAERPREECPAVGVLATGLPIEVDDDYLQRRDGTFLAVEYTSAPIRVEGKITGGVVSFQDVSVRKQAEAALRSAHDDLELRVEDRTAALRVSEERYRLLFENNPQPMWVFDEETLAFLAINNAACTHYGYTRDEFLGMTIRDIRPTEDVPTLLKHIEAEASTYQDAGVWRHRKKSGAVIEVEITSHPLVFDARAAQLVLAVDVTERRTLEEQLRQSQKMEAIGQLAGGIAHDFNNLLTAVLGYADLALGQVTEDSPLRDDLGEIRKAGERAVGLTRQLLAFSRKQVIEPRILDLNELIADMEGLLRRLLGERIDLAFVRQASLAQVKADPGQIEQILVNLAVNARDAMPNGGKLTVETGNVELDDVYAAQHVGVRPGKYVMLAVSDTGSGMNTETLSRIFEPFFTTKEKGKGTGLGLSTVYGIVKQSAGHVWVYSEPGRGSSFKIYMPATGERPTSATLVVRAGSHSGRETILLIEDEDSVRRLARITLERKGYTIIEAENGDDAVQKAAKTTGPIDLFLSDAVMPGMDVPAMSVRLRALFPGARFLLMSGYTDEAVLRHGIIEAGGAFLQKPFTSESLTRKVRETLDAPVASGQETG